MRSMDNYSDGKGLFSKIGETITIKGKEVSGKAKDMADIANLRSQIRTCEEVIKKNYMEIGKSYFELHASMPEEAYEEQCRAINNAQIGIAELENKIKEIKGV